MAKGKYMADLTMKIGADVAELKKGLKQAKGGIQKFSSQAKRAGRDFKQSMSSSMGTMGMMVNPQIAMFQGLLGGAFRAMKTLTAGTKLFKIALAATGIGLLVIALGSLAAWLSTTNEGMLMVNKVTESVGAIMGVVVDRIAKLGKAIALIFKGEFTEAWETAKEAVSGIGDEILDVGKKALGIADDEQKFQNQKIKGDIEIGKLLEKNGDLRLEAKNKEKNTAKERKGFFMEEIKNIRRITELRTREADNDIELLKRRQALGNNTLKDDQELADLLLNRGRLIRENVLKEKEVFDMVQAVNLVEERRLANQIKIATKAQEELKLRTELAEVIGVSSDTSKTIIDAELRGLDERMENLKEFNLMRLEENAAAEAAILAQQESETIRFTDLAKNAFQGMSNVITQSLNSTQNIFEAFGKFFATFIKGMIIKLVSATIAALALVAVMSFITGGGGAFAAVNQAVGFGKKFGAAFNLVGGFAEGGITGGGLTMVGERGKEMVNLPAGTRVHSNQDTMKMLGGGAGKVIITDSIIRGEDIYIAYEEYARKLGNTR